MLKSTFSLTMLIIMKENRLYCAQIIGWINKMTKLLTPEVIKQLKGISDVEPRGIISASTNFSESRREGKGELDHYIGVATSSNETEDFDVLKIDASTWAVFESI